MIFLDQYNNIINNNLLEVEEQRLANIFIQPDDIVLELGARYGSVSCVINSKLNNKKNQVSVEPDERVWEALEKNMELNKCSFNIIKGFISNKKLSLENLDDYYGGYGSTFIDDEKSKIQSYTLEEVQNKFNLKFNVLVADCEGFLERFFDENEILYSQLYKVIFETDYGDKCNYKKIKENLINAGFTPIIDGFQSVYIKK